MIQKIGVFFTGIEDDVIHLLQLLDRKDVCTALIVLPNSSWNAIDRDDFVVILATVVGLHGNGMMGGPNLPLDIFVACHVNGGATIEHPPILEIIMKVLYRRHRWHTVLGVLVFYRPLDPTWEVK